MAEAIRHFYDIDLNFTKNPITGDIAKRIDANAVKQSLYNLLMNKMFDVPFHPEITGGIKRLLFENFNPATSIIVENQIKTVISNWEPRVEIIAINIEEDWDNNAVRIYITFRMVNTNVKTTMDFYVYRQR